MRTSCLPKQSIAKLILYKLELRVPSIENKITIGRNDTIRFEDDNNIENNWFTSIERHMNEIETMKVTKHIGYNCRRQEAKEGEYI